MSTLLKRTWAEVDLDKIALNIKMIKQALPHKCMVLGVVKADAYGHGDKYVAKTMIENGVNWLGVSNLNEALSLRKQGIYHPILIFGATPVERASDLCEYNITQAILSKEYALELQSEAQKKGIVVDTHVKLDTGMGRIGFDASKLEQTVQEIIDVKHFSNIHVSGIFTHFSCSDSIEKEDVQYANMQYKRFKAVCDTLKEQGEEIKLCHCCNSGAVVNFPEWHMDMVRPGILGYGIYPSESRKRDIGIESAMSFYTTIAMVKNVPKGSQLSYGRTYTAETDMVIATVPIGYADGYSRALSNKGQMIVNGCRARVVGRVCMDQLMLDVTGIPDVQEGMVVTIVGKDGDECITFDDYAQSVGTIAYESICLVGKRVPRVYKKDGKQIDVIDYVEKCSL